MKKDSKNLNRPSSKKCTKHCEGYIVNSATGEYCPHIEAKLPKPFTGTSVRSHPSLFIDKMSRTCDLYPSTTETRIKYMERRLFNYGLSKFEVDLLVARYVEEKTMEDIKKEQNWTSRGSLSHFLRETLKKLRKLEFKL